MEVVCLFVSFCLRWTVDKQDIGWWLGAGISRRCDDGTWAYECQALSWKRLSIQCSLSSISGLEHIMTPSSRLIMHFCSDSNFQLDASARAYFPPAIAFEPCARANGMAMPNANHQLRPDPKLLRTCCVKLSSHQSLVSPVADLPIRFCNSSKQWSWPLAVVCG